MNAKPSIKYTIQLSKVFVTVLFLFILIKTYSQQNSSTQLIINAIVYDGSGKASQKVNVRIQGDKLIAIGKLLPQKNEQVIDAHGGVLAPGFIDSHSHHFGDVQRNPNAISTANQGITTIVIGQDGEGDWMDSLQAKLKSNPVSVNVASYAGHSTLREEVMGEARLMEQSSPAEIEKMKLLLANEMKKGALGLSTGLEYEQAFYSSKDEVMQLSKLAASFNGRYISHIRSEDIHMEEALDEIIQIGKATKMPVQISHIKIAKKENWGTAKDILLKLEAARKEGVDITADIYPYDYWHSTLRVLFPAHDYENIKSAEFAVNQLFDPKESFLVQFAPNLSYKGKTIHQIALLRNETDAVTLMNLIAMASKFKAEHADYKGSIEAIVAKSMSESDVTQFIQWKHTNICSDGNAGAHPRGYGSFTRILGRYVRERKVLSLEDAIHKMTGMTADHLGIKDRGYIKEGNFADLVLLDPSTVIDNAIIGNSNALSTGIKMVWVNGKIVYQNQQSTGIHSGVLIQRK